MKKRNKQNVKTRRNARIEKNRRKKGKKQDKE